MKRSLLFFVIAVFLPLAASADRVKVGDLYYNFVLKAKLATVASCPIGECYEGDVVIPATVEHKGVVCNVTSIDDYAFVYIDPSTGRRSTNYQLLSVTIPESVTSIGIQAFYSCSSLTSLSIPDGVTKIGDSAFSDCSSLKSIKLPNGLISIPAGWFTGCSSLASVDIPETVTEIGSSAFGNCQNLLSIDLQNVTSIGNSAFYGCSKLTTITMSDNLLIIDDNAFYGCTNLSTIKWSENLRKIGNAAFFSCKTLESVVLPNSVISIGGAAFCDCSNLTTVSIGSSILEVGQSAFGDCKELTDVYCYAPLPTYDADIFTNSRVDYATLHVAAGFINQYKESPSWNGFGTYMSLSEEDMGLDPIKSKRIISFADPKVKALCVSNWDINGDGELSEAEAAWPTSFSDVDLWDYDNNGVFDDEEVRCARGANGHAYHIFADKTEIRSFEELKYFTGLKSIEVDAFHGCTNLTKIILPKGVDRIDDGAFDNCRKLTSIIIPDHVTFIGYQSFYSCTGLTTVNMGTNVERIENWAFSGCSNLSTINLPESLNSIGYAAFSHCSSLTSITIPDNVTNIGSESFSHCSSLISATLGKSLERIEDYSFNNCSSLETVTIPNSVTSIGSSAFSQCYSLEEVRSLIKDPSPIGEYVFSDYTIPLYVPTGTTEKYMETTGWDKFTNIIEVDVPEPVSVTSLTLNKAKLSMRVGSSTKLNATVLPENAEDKSVTWSTSDKTVATIAADGTMKGIKAGTATITCTSVENPSIFAKCIVTVIEGGLIGDINNDGEVDVTDVVELIDMVLGGIYDAVGDINGDGEVDVTDVVELIDMVLAGG